ncbi:MAG: hypothetical protein H6619_05025 [Deltaproteobacteria bacterium]|nr:hypothetical protein [Deltaproteobacteria bacterium]
MVEPAREEFAEGLQNVPTPAADSIEIPLPQDAKIFEVRPDGLPPHIKVNGVHDILLDTPTPPKELIDGYIQFAKQQGIQSCWIVDTVPSSNILHLVSGLVEAGITVHFRDHHKPEVTKGQRDENENSNARIIQQILASSEGSTFERTTRREVQSSCSMVETGQALLDKKAMIIGGPPDLDRISTGFKLAGLRFDSLHDDSDPGTMEDWVGLIDSPRFNGPQRAAIAADGATSKSPEKPLVYAMMIEGSDTLQCGPESRVKTHELLAQILKEGDLGGEKADQLDLLNQTEALRRQALKLLIQRGSETHKVGNGLLTIVDLYATPSRATIAKLSHNPTTGKPFTDLPEAIAGVTGTASAQITTGTIRQALKDIHRRDPENRVVIVLIATDNQGGREALFFTTGDYDSKRGINFSRLNEGEDKKIFRGMGHIGFVRDSDIEAATRLVMQEMRIRGAREERARVKADARFFGHDRRRRE